MEKIIKAYRRMQGVSQEEMAKILGISAAAISKWERGISVPDMEMLCRLADYYGITVDKLLGRDPECLVDLSFENQMEADRYFAALHLLEICKIARNQGLLAVEEFANKENGLPFLRFAVVYVIEGLQKGMTMEECREYLPRYAESEKDVRTAQMISEGLLRIFSGENEMIIKEFLKSYLGRKFLPLIPAEEEEIRWKMEREEAIKYYANLETGCSDTQLLDILLDTEDKLLQLVLRQLEREDLALALAGASGKVREKVLRNLSDRLIHVIGEQMSHAHAGQEIVENCQHAVLRTLHLLQ